MKNDLAKYLATHIPLAGAMQVAVEQATEEGVTVSMPLEPNINHRGTAFGGSVSALAMLAGWGFVWTVLREARMAGTIVIRRNSMSFDHPMAGPVTAHCTAPDATTMRVFFEMLEIKRKARLSLPVHLFCAGRETATFTGEFVVVV